MGLSVLSLCPSVNVKHLQSYSAHQRDLFSPAEDSAPEVSELPNLLPRLFSFPLPTSPRSIQYLHNACLQRLVC